MKKPTISTIIPTYNRAEFLPRAIESILNQSLSVDEIIVVDDGSSDNTKDIVSKYPVTYIYKDNGGVSSTRNMGILSSNSEYITFLDSDDEWHKDKIKEQVEYHNNNPHIQFSHTDEKWIRGDKEIKKKGFNLKKEGYIFKESLFNCTIGASTVMIHRDIFDDIGVFDESLEVCEDYDLWLRVAKKYEIGLIPKELITKYAGHEQLSFKYWGMDRYRIIALQKHIDTIDIDDKDAVIEEIVKKIKYINSRSYQKR
jgi:glycosyltransferase involved in cell wall biosynthesis